LLVKRYSLSYDLGKPLDEVLSIVFNLLKSDALLSHAYSEALYILDA
jgi:hypothetical protein